jgi:hypothetical protein
MKWNVLVLLVAGFMAPGVCSAQGLKSGTWTGAVTPPGGAPTLVTYDIATSGDSLSIVIHAGEHGDFSAGQERYADGKLTFTFEPGPVVSCTLTTTADGGFSGSCFEPTGGEAKITMVPPTS